MIEAAPNHSYKNTILNESCGKRVLLNESAICIYHNTLAQPCLKRVDSKTLNPVVFFYIAINVD